jgi:transglutaminase-like putative cysteine protease
MTSRERMTLAAAVAVALCTSALSPMFIDKAWGAEVFGAVLAVAVAGLVGRRLSLPRVLQPVFGLLVLTGYLVVVFAPGTLSHGVPTVRTADLLRSLVDSANTDIKRYRAPVPTSEGMVLLSAAGVGAVAVLVDLLAVVLLRPALAGLPLLALFAVPAAVVPGGVGWLAFVLGGAGWLLLLTVEGRDVVSRWGPTAQGAPLGESSLGRMGRRIGAGALGVAVVVPLLVPGLGKTLIHGNGTAGDGDGGSSSAHTFNPITQLRSQLNLPEPVQLFRYRTDDPQPDYIRMTTLDRYDGAGWSASPLSQRRSEAQVQKGIDPPLGDAAAHQSLTMRIAMDHDNLDVFWLPLPYGPRRVDVKGTWLWDPASQTAFSASRTTKDLPAYDVEAERVLPDAGALAAARTADVDPDVLRRYGRQINVTDAVRALTSGVIAGATSPYDRAIALQQWFTDPGNRFRYDLDPEPAPAGEDLLQDFLLSSRRGFCEQYATAMAAMLRVAGVPSRVAVGFTHGSLVPGSAKDGARTFSVSTHDAHAWPEAWFAGTGWVRFEPTPAESGATVPGYAQPGAEGPTPNQPQATASPTPQATATARSNLPEEDLLGEQGGAGSDQDQGSSRWLVWVLAGTGIVLLLALPPTLTALRRRRRWRRPGPLVAWEQLREDADDVGYRWHTSDSPRAAAARLRAHRRLSGPASEALDRIAIATERARYARPDSAEAAGRLRADVDVVRESLHEGCGRWLRWRARVCPPSTVWWARRGAGELVEGATGRIDDGVAKVKQLARSSRA